MSDVFAIEGSYNLVDNVTNTLKKVQSNVNKTGKELTDQEKAWGKLKTASGNAMNKIDGYVKTGLLAVGGLTGGMIALGIKSNASLESSKASWETLLGSQEKAKTMLDDITKFAATTPFSKMGVDAMAKQLQNAGYSGEDLFKQLTKFGDMGGAFGVQEDSLKEMVRQYSQVQMAQVAYTEDLNILQDRGIPIYKALSETMGVSVADVKKMASEGKITAEVYNAAVDSIANTTKGSMEKQSATFNGMWSTIKDNFTNIMQQVIEPLFAKIVEKMPLIIQFFDTFSAKLGEGKGVLESIKESITQIFGEDVMAKIEKMVEIVTFLAGAYLALKTVMFVSNLITSLSAAWGVLSAMLTTTTVIVDGVTVSQTGLNLAFLACPVTWIILAIGAIVAGFVYLWNNVEGFRNFWLGVVEAIKTGAVNLGEGVVSAFNFLLDNASRIFDLIVGAITNPMGAAVNVVSWGINKILDLFDFQWEFPYLKMPHFTFTGSINPLKWGELGVPKVGVEWYSKGGIFTQPTVLGNIGVGDAQNGTGNKAEAVMPIDDLRGMIKDLLQVQIAMVVDGREFVRQVVAPHNEEISEYNRQFSY